MLAWLTPQQTRRKQKPGTRQGLSSERCWRDGSSSTSDLPGAAWGLPGLGSLWCGKGHQLGLDRRKPQRPTSTEQDSGFPWGPVCSTHSISTVPRAASSLVSLGSACQFPMTTDSGLKQHAFILLQFWRPEDPNQGVGRATLPLGALGKNLFLASSSFWRLLVFLALWTHHFSLQSQCHLLFSLCV